MAKEEGITLMGKVVELLPNTTFKVELENGVIALAYLGGKLRQFKININLGDNVELVFSPYDLKRGRITYRR